jgi:[acyl-carrier-protein] S-malonyltransferase
MGQDLYDGSAAARDLFAEADDALGFALSRIIRNGPDAELRRTAITQPAILLVSVAAYRALDLSPAAVAGHSWGKTRRWSPPRWRFLTPSPRAPARQLYAGSAARGGAHAGADGVEARQTSSAIAADGGVDIANDNAPG